MTMNGVSTSKVLLSATALAAGLTGCESEPTGTEPPPPPPPPSAAEVSIVSFVDPETGTELPQGDDGIMVSGRMGVVIDFDTGGMQAQSLDLILEDASGATDVVPCTAFSGQGARGLRADVRARSVSSTRAKAPAPVRARRRAPDSPTVATRSRPS